MGRALMEGRIPFTGRVGGPAVRALRVGGVVAALLLVLAACGGGESATPAANEVVDRHPDAIPDFVLALNDGSTFQLGEEVQPVFLIFWAEW
jgi:hypothetical protein